MSDLRPTHTCFDDAPDLVVAELKEGNRDIARALIVHGICLAPDKRAFSHCWLEFDGHVVETYLCDNDRVHLAYPIALWRERFQPQYEVRYSLAEWFKLNHDSGHYGPWDPRVKALITDGSSDEWKLGTVEEISKRGLKIL